jgi:hypothetical protein
VELSVSASVKMNAIFFVLVFFFGYGDIWEGRTQKEEEGNQSDMNKRESKSKRNGILGMRGV